MTHPLTMERFDEAFAPTPLPAPDSCIVLRPQLAECLDLGVTGLLTLVQAPVGAGKTTSTATWASGVPQARGLVWIDLDARSSRPNDFLGLLVGELTRAGATGMPVLPTVAQMSPARRRSTLSAVADGLRGTGPWILVVDNFPTGRPGQLGADIEWLMQSCDRALRVVLLASAEPAIALHRIRMAGELSTITGNDLDLDREEIAELLRAFQVDPLAHVVEAVMGCTHGWACGVRLMAAALRDRSLGDALAFAEHAVEEFVSAEVLEKLPPDSRDFVLHTSFAETVPVGLAGLVTGSDTELAGARAADTSAFVERDLEGTMRVHPVMRAVALRKAIRESKAQVQIAAGRAARWYAEEGDVETAVRLALLAEDWSWAATTLVESLAVPRILAGAGHVEEIPMAVLDHAPVLMAAVAIAQGNLAHAESALQMCSRPDALDSPLDALSRCLVELEIARRTGNLTRGFEIVEHAHVLLGQLPVGRHAEAADVKLQLDGVTGVLELIDGQLHRAAVTLGRAAMSLDAARGSTIRREALGNLALLEALRGNLRRSAGACADVLEASRRLGGTAGIRQAHLAAAWTHLDRNQVQAAQQRLDTFDCVGSGVDPWLSLVRGLLDARLMTESGRPEAAIRTISAMQGGHELPTCGWLGDLGAIHLARAYVALEEPRRALAVLTPEPDRCRAEASVVAAQARFAIGDVRGARALLSAATSDLARTPLEVQVEAWLLEARLACDDGQGDRARQLVDRGLRAASAEELRSPLVAVHSWLRGIVGRDAALMRSHREFLAAIQPRQPSPQGPSTDTVSLQHDEQVVEPLTDRERQVLELLAMMCSTEEIAAELYVSGNTVKTHVKGIFRKLGVNRRVDAVRAGRNHGLC